MGRDLLFLVSTAVQARLNTGNSPKLPVQTRIGTEVLQASAIHSQHTGTLLVLLLRPTYRVPRFQESFSPKRGGFQSTHSDSRAGKGASGEGRSNMDSAKRASAPRTHILDRQIVAAGKGGKPAEVSLSAFSFMFSEMVQYFQDRVTSIADLERKLEEVGYGMGLRVLELQTFRERLQKRRVRLLPMLQWVSSNVWKALFGKTADSLERSTENDDEYMIHEREPMTNSFVSVPADLGQLNCAALVAGVIAGVLDGASFPARVSAHNVEMEEGQRDKTVFLIKFDPEVLQREARLG